MTSPVSDVALQGFLRDYPPVPYNHRDREYPLAELVPVGPDDGLWYMNEVPESPPRGVPRRSHDEDGQNCHLWVIDERGRPCISEAPLARLGEGKLHHTNLTGGGEASIGGEAWFDEVPRVYLSGSSGRYPPQCREHLEKAVRLFTSVGFEVVSLGWDIEMDKPQRVWDGQAPGGRE